MLLTDEWPAPAVAAWKGVAELFRDGIDGLPPMAFEAMLIGGGIGIVLAILEKVLPKKVRTFVPSPAAVGIAIVVPAYYRDQHVRRRRRLGGRAHREARVGQALHHHHRRRPHRG